MGKLVCPCSFLEQGTRASEYTCPCHTTKSVPVVHFLQGHQHVDNCVQDANLRLGGFDGDHFFRRVTLQDGLGLFHVNLEPAADDFVAGVVHAVFLQSTAAKSLDHLGLIRNQVDDLQHVQGVFEELG